MKNLYLVEWHNGQEYEDYAIETICVYKNKNAANKVCDIFQDELSNIIRAINGVSVSIPRPVYDFSDKSSQKKFYKDLEIADKKILNFAVKLLKQHGLPAELANKRFWSYPKGLLTSNKIQLYE